ncbi:MAG: VacJ family lipoprotein [Desulfovibrionaceae bacterium]|nr:VacJ family lipoprotein [Desulfovibrionaceae bacterium]
MQNLKLCVCLSCVLILGLSVVPKAFARDADSYFKPGAFIISEDKSSMAQTGATDAVADDLDDYDIKTTADIADPLEGWNRFWFNFNDRFFRYVAKPLYRGWVTITPAPVRGGLKNFFHNLLFPVRFVNCLLQFRLKAAGVEFSRFMMNTMCSAGFANPAAKKKTIVPMDPIGEDFGQTLGVWGVGHGAYVVWPFLGPSSLRDTLGRIGDMFADPLFYVDPWYAAFSAGAVLRINNLDTVLPLYEDLTGAALDPYISMREAYINFRNNHVGQ